jgi:erythromycin esterase-like protein
MFAAQTRLVAFLHDRLGFTVLAWEAGLWSCETDATHCVGWPWGVVVETRGVRPPPPGVRVTGFDFQFTGTRREDSLDLLRGRLTLLAAADSTLVARLATAFARFPKMQHFRLLTVEDRTVDRQAFRDTLALLEKHRDVSDFELLRRAVENVIGLYDWHEAVHADVSTTIDWSRNALDNVRDRAMADNLLWLMNVRYPGQKFILWLATSHAARDLSVLSEPSGGVDPSDRTGFRSMGSWLSDALGASYFALGMTAYEGEIGNPPQQKEIIVGPASPRSIDGVWAPAAEPFRFVSRRALGNTPTEARFVGLHGFIAPWGRVLDGGLVFRTVTPTTPETAESVASPVASIRR